MTTTKLGKYELHDELGRGGFGTVYRATDTVLGREVALKVLHPQLTVDADFIQRFRNEARRIAAFDHPNIATVYDMGEESGRVFIAMRYFPGGSLRDRLKREGAIPFEQALQIVKQVGAGLKTAHGEGLVHRDIKPENILFTKTGEAVITDFGLAQNAELTPYGRLLSETSGGVLGTPQYIAPEIWDDQPATPAADEYALACVAYESLMGDMLFSGSTPLAVMKRHVEGPHLTATWPTGVPDGVTDVLLKALAKDPRKRYANTSKFAGALEGLLPTSQPPPPALPRRWLRYVVLAVAIGVMVRLLWPSPLPPSPVPPSPPPNSRATPSATSVAAFISTPAPLPTSLLPAPPLAPLSISTATVGPVPTLPLLAPPIEPTAPPEPLPTQIVGSEGAIMRLVLAGEFTMGSDSGEEDAKPAHTVSLDSFYIDEYEVTNGQYEVCVGAGPCNPPLHVGSNTRQTYYGGSAYSDYPVIWVTWFMAKAYCEWRGTELPTEAQWEKAARGTDGRTYPWGNNIDYPYANYGNPLNGDTTKVGHYPSGRSPYGLYDMAGNVGEWVADQYDPNYYHNSPVLNPSGPESGLYGVLRGGTWGSPKGHLAAFYRLSIDRSSAAGTFIGFRCSRSP